MCQVSSFNSDHEKCIQGCNCCKSKDSAAAVSATLAERERIIKLLEDVVTNSACDCEECSTHLHIDRIELKILVGFIKGEK